MAQPGDRIFTDPGDIKALRKADGDIGVTPV
jgi:hypothetical protein